MLPLADQVHHTLPHPTTRFHSRAHPPPSYAERHSQLAVGIRLPPHHTPTRLHHTIHSPVHNKRHLSLTSSLPLSRRDRHLHSHPQTCYLIDNKHLKAAPEITWVLVKMLIYFATTCADEAAQQRQHIWPPSWLPITI